MIKKPTYNMPFDPSKINMDSKVLSLYTLMSRVRFGEISTSSYQRNEVWNDIAKSRLIESLIVRIPIPVFYIDATNEDEWLIIDGLQRITALKEFIINDDKKLNPTPLVLTNLEYIKELEGSTFDDLPRAFQRRVLETDITIVFINPGTPENVKRNIFQRINTGGSPLTKQEIRNALYDTQATTCLQNIVSILDFQLTWAKGKSDNNRMALNELVLRAFSLWFLDKKIIYSAESIDTYLDQGMEVIDHCEQEILALKTQDFIRAYKIVLEIFDDYAFRKIDSNNTKKTPVNKNIYEMWMFSLRHLNPKQRNILVNNKKKVIFQFSELLKIKTFGWAVSSRKSETIQYRNEMLTDMLMDIINND
ncbi:DUF262 domain-containing protein [Aliivibrio sifiae]|uniref:DUF262 domain-containing protein n=1 Tax=Aliivibrio sifiae TaxID=566293 RepID=UPI003D0A2AF4